MSRTRWPRDPHKERFWRRYLRRWQRSGLTVRDFCRRQQLHESAFYFWQREIAKRDRELAASGAPVRQRSPRHVPKENRDILKYLCGKGVILNLFG